MELVCGGTRRQIVRLVADKRRVKCLRRKKLQRRVRRPIIASSGEVLALDNDEPDLLLVGATLTV